MHLPRKFYDIIRTRTKAAGPYHFQCNTQALSLASTDAFPHSHIPWFHSKTLRYDVQWVRTQKNSFTNSTFANFGEAKRFYHIPDFGFPLIVIIGGLYGRKITKSNTLCDTAIATNQPNRQSYVCRKLYCFFHGACRQYYILLRYHPDISLCCSIHQFPIERDLTSRRQFLPGKNLKKSCFS
jgi:hypothetical protein